MKRIKLSFVKCIQHSQDYGSNDEHMVSRVFFNIDVSGKIYDNLYANIKQPVGGNYETEPIEVSLPVGYNGILNYQRFQEGVEKYYRSCVGSNASGIRISGGGNVIMRNNTIIRNEEIQFEVDDKDLAW